MVDGAFKTSAEFEVVKSRIRDLMSSYVVQLKGNLSFAITAFHDPGGEFSSAAGILISKRQAIDDFIFSMKPSQSGRDGVSMDRALETVAYRLNWHRNSRKIIFVFGDSLPDKPEDVQNLARNLADGENSEVNMFVVNDKRKLSEAYDKIARIGKGECRQLDAAGSRR
jgi:hypothetical protein